MKNIPLILILFFNLLLAKGQIYHPLPDSNVIWKEFYNNYFYSPCDKFDDNQLFLSHDTVISGKSYKTLLQSGHIYSNCPPPGWFYYNQYKGAIRQDIPNKKVFYNENGQDTLLYDFNLKLHDTLPLSYINTYGVTLIDSIDSVLIGVNYHKRFWLSTQNVQLIEGIGSTKGLLSKLDPSGLAPFSNILQCVRINNAIVYPNNSSDCSLLSISNNTTIEIISVAITPNPFNKHSLLLLNLTTPANTKIVVYNSLGQQVSIIENSYLQAGSHSYDLNIFEKGIYLMQVIINETPYTYKIIQTD